MGPSNSSYLSNIAIFQAILIHLGGGFKYFSPLLVLGEMMKFVVLIIGWNGVSLQCVMITMAFSSNKVVNNWGLFELFVGKSVGWWNMYFTYPDFIWTFFLANQNDILNRTAATKAIFELIMGFLHMIPWNTKVKLLASGDVRLTIFYGLTCWICWIICAV